jgi:DNA polymerase III epsilon subunit-like protein
MLKNIGTFIYNGINWIKTVFTPLKQERTTVPSDEPRERISIDEPIRVIHDYEETEITINLYNDNINDTILEPDSPKLSIQIPECKYYMFLDTETTGIPEQKSYNKYYEPYLINYYDGARMIELGYLITDDNGNKIKEQSFLVKPNGFVIKNSHIHGITTEHATESGLDIREILEIFHADLQTVDKLICHNINFDKHILLSECYREYRGEVDVVKKLKTITQQCTMEMGKRVFKLDKPPKLVYLYKKIFDMEPVQEHRALSDVNLCCDCYFNIHKT